MGPPVRRSQRRAKAQTKPAKQTEARCCFAYCHRPEAEQDPVTKRANVLVKLPNDVEVCRRILFGPGKWTSQQEADDRLANLRSDAPLLVCQDHIKKRSSRRTKNGRIGLTVADFYRPSEDPVLQLMNTENQGQGEQSLPCLPDTHRMLQRLESVGQTATAAQEDAFETSSSEPKHTGRLMTKDERQAAANARLDAKKEAIRARKAVREEQKRKRDLEREHARAEKQRQKELEKAKAQEAKEAARRAAVEEEARRKRQQEEEQARKTQEYINWLLNDPTTTINSLKQRITQLQAQVDDLKRREASALAQVEDLKAQAKAKKALTPARIKVLTGLSMDEFELLLAVLQRSQLKQDYLGAPGSVKISFQEAILFVYCKMRVNMSLQHICSLVDVDLSQGTAGKMFRWMINGISRALRQAIEQTGRSESPASFDSTHRDNHHGAGTVVSPVDVGMADRAGSAEVTGSSAAEQDTDSSPAHAHKGAQLVIANDHKIVGRVRMFKFLTSPIPNDFANIVEDALSLCLDTVEIISNWKLHEVRTTVTPEEAQDHVDGPHPSHHHRNHHHTSSSRASSATALTSSHFSASVGHSIASNTHDAVDHPAKRAKHS